MSTDTMTEPSATEAQADYTTSASTEGIALVWDVRLPKGGAVRVTMTPTRATWFMGVAREMAPQLCWQAGQAMSAEATRAFARALLAAADKAESLPRADVG